MNELVLFLKNPSLGQYRNQTFKEELKCFFSAYLFCLIFIIVSAFLILILDLILKNELDIPSPMANYHQTMSRFYQRFGEYSFMVIVMIAPVLEETMFRLYLTLNKWMVLLSAVVLTYAFTGPVLSTNIGLNFYLRFSVVMLVFILLQLIVTREGLTKLKSNYYYLVFYFSALFFGMIHISNFKPLNEKILFIYPLLVLPQIGMGLSLGYVRVKLKNGFLWGVLLHSFINMPAALLSLL